jgi:O-antigen/teichoic acid export membrane protein
VIALAIAFHQTGFEIPKFSRMKSYIKWGLPLIPNDIITWVLQASDRYLVTYFLGVSSAGIYNAAYNLGQFASFTMIPLGVVLYPNVIKTYDEDRKSETQKYLKYSTKYVMMVAIPAAFGLSILAKPLLSILTTPEFISGNVVVPFTAFGSVLYCFYNMGFYIINIVNKTYLTARLLAIAAVLNVVLNLILIPRLGLIGAAMTTTISSGALGILTLAVTRRYLRFDLSLPFIAKSIFASSLMTLIIWLIHPESLAIILVSIIVGATIYFGVLVLIRGLSRGEIVFFINFTKDNLKGIFSLKNKVNKSA